MAYIAMRFIETPIFTRIVSRFLTDDAYRVLQLTLLLRPEQGTLIKGSGGLRKMCWASHGHGKRGGIRVIYYWAAPEQMIYMLYMYAKSEQSDLSAAQLKILARLVKEEFK